MKFKFFNKLTISVLLVITLFAIRDVSEELTYAQSSAGPTQAIFVRASADFSSINPGYTNILTNEVKLVNCTLVNGTNQPLSWDDGTTAISDNEFPLSKEFYDFGSNNRYVGTTIRLKYTTTQPTSGTAYINCY